MLLGLGKNIPAETLDNLTGRDWQVLWNHYPTTQTDQEYGFDFLQI
jgi:hypothetical protein